MGYEKTTWNPGAAPGISAANLNKLETQYDEAMADSGAELDAHEINAVAPGQHRWGAGKVLFGAGVGADPTEIIIGVPIVVRKTADETVKNSSDLQNDNELLLAVAANEIWAIYLLLRKYQQAGATKATIIAFTIPTGASMRKAIFSATSGTQALAPESDATSILSLAVHAGYINSFLFPFLYIGGGNAGTVQLQWAQFTAEAYDHTVLANSYILAHKLA